MLPEYVVAMKLAALRQYKYDFSDFAGVVKETGITREKIERAVYDLYGGMDKLTCSKQAADLLDDIYSSSDLNGLYRKYHTQEIEGFEIFKQADTDYKGFLNRDNVNDVIAAIREKQGSQKTGG